MQPEAVPAPYTAYPTTSYGGLPPKNTGQRTLLVLGIVTAALACLSFVGFWLGYLAGIFGLVSASCGIVAAATGKRNLLVATLPVTIVALLCLAACSIFQGVNIYGVQNCYECRKGFSEDECKLLAQYRDEDCYIMCGRFPAADGMCNDSGSGETRLQVSEAAILVMFFVQLVASIVTCISFRTRAYLAAVPDGPLLVYQPPRAQQLNVAPPAAGYPGTQSYAV